MPEKNMRGDAGIGVCIPPLRIVRMRRIVGVALAVGDETTADGTELHPPLLLCLPSV